MKVRLPELFTNRFNRSEPKKSAHRTESLPKSTIEKTSIHTPSSIDQTPTRSTQRKATVFSEFNPIANDKKITTEKTKSKAAAFFKGLQQKIVDIPKLIQATTIYNRIKKECLNLNVENEKNELKIQLSKELNLGDLHRFKVTIQGETFDASANITEINDKKEARLHEFCMNDQNLYENIIKTAHQGLPSGISLIISPQFLAAQFSVGSQEFSANQGLKEITIKRDNDGNIHCSVQVPFPVLPLTRQVDPLITIKATVTVIIPEEDLKKGIVDSAQFRSNVELI